MKTPSAFICARNYEKAETYSRRRMVRNWMFATHPFLLRQFSGKEIKFFITKTAKERKDFQKLLEAAVHQDFEIIQDTRLC